MANEIVLKIVEALGKSEMPVTVVKVNPSPEVKAWLNEAEREVSEYVNKIEEAHRIAAKSTLRFGAKIEALDYPVPFFF